MSPPKAGPVETQWFQTQGAQIYHWIWLGLGGVIVIGLVIGLSQHFPLTGFYFMAAGLVIAIMVVAGLVAWNRVPRKVGISASGVEFVYPLSRCSLRWDQLQRPRDVGMGYVLFEAKRGTPGVRFIPLWVTTDQASEIRKRAPPEVGW